MPVELSLWVGQVEEVAMGLLLALPKETEAPQYCPATPLSSSREREEACLHAEKSVQSGQEKESQNHMSFMGGGRK